MMAANWMDRETNKLIDLWSEDAIQAMLCHTLINCFFRGSIIQNRTEHKGSVVSSNQLHF